MKAELKFHDRFEPEITSDSKTLPSSNIVVQEKIYVEISGAESFYPVVEIKTNVGPQGPKGDDAKINALLTPENEGKIPQIHNGDFIPVDPSSGGGLPSGGNVGDLIWKNAENQVSWVTPANKAEQDNTKPITSAAVYMEIGNINALLATI